MASQVQYRRGTNAQNAAFTGALGEITVDTTNGTLRVHDAITVGGSNIATVAYVTAQISALSSNSISSGTSNVRVFANGNVTTSAAGTANVLVVQSTGALITGDLSVTGNATLSGNILGDRIVNGTTSIEIQTADGNSNISVAGTSNVAVFASTGVFITGVNSVSGNVTGGNILTAGLISATGAITGAALTGTSLTVSTGNVSCGNIVNTNANGVGNIGSSATRFNQVFALASSAQYADLAEKYTADADYVPGTVLEFGGDQEVTATTTSHSPRVAGIVSTQPSYIMNDGLVSDHTAMVSLTGRLPCLVQGPIAKGDRLVASAVVGHAQRLDPAQYEPGCIIGKALEDYPSPNTGTIEVAVGRF